ncbi:MAG: CheW-like domain [Verrucomicrobiota bacterium]|jgi:purine-binding chemotaxis protein CheW
MTAELPAPPPAPATPAGSGATVMHLVAARCRQRFALPVAFIREVLPIPVLEPVPLADPSLRGAFQLRGEIIPVLSPDALLAVNAEGEAPAEVLALLQGESGLLGLAFDRILGVIPLPVEGLMLHPLAARRPWMARLHLDPRFQLVTVLDGPALARAAAEAIAFHTTH